MKIKSKICLSKTIILLIAYFSLINNVFSSPILRIEVGQHTAMINRMAVDKDTKLLATASDDKTVRLWNLPEGTLYTTLRVPIGEQLIGALYAVAVSPDGKTVIASGQTIGADKKISLYVFDVEKRVLKARLSNLPTDVFHLAYSKDGKYFAASLAGGFGIRVWDSQTGKLVAQDTDYSDRSNWLDFNESGNLATVSYDGYVRIYDSHFTLLKKTILTAQGKPNSISFSANGQLLAIGYSNLMKVDIVDLNLDRVNSLPTENLIGTNTAIVTWQKNSNTALFASGDMKTKDGDFVVRHWRNIDPSSRDYKDIEVSENTVTDIISFADNSESGIDFLFSSADPSWGIIKKDKSIIKNQAKLWDARTVELPNKTFSISEDGLTVAYSEQQNSNKIAVFDITHRTLQTLDDKNELLKTLSPAIKEHPKFKITNSQQNVPSFNGKILNLEKIERSLTWAIAPKSDYTLFGTNYYLRMYDAHGIEIKKVPVPAEVYAVNISVNGRLAVAALGDGTIHWYSLSPGKELNELLTLFPYNNDNKDWIIWTQEGFFGSSDGGGYHLAGYHLNKGENKRPEWIEFSQIYQTYYAPELILPKLSEQDDKIQSKLSSIGNIGDLLNKNEVPIIELTEYCTAPIKTGTKAFIRTSAVTEANTTDLSYYEKFKLFLHEIYDWFKSLFNTKNSDAAVLQVKELKSSDSPDMHTCQSITGQGQTRSYTRKERIQTATTHNITLGSNTDSIDLNFVVKPRKGGVGDIDIYVNGQIQHTLKQASSASPDVKNQDLKITQNISVKEGENIISIRAYEKTGGATAKSDTVALYNPAINRSVIVDSIDKSKSKPNLIVFAIGINSYPSPYTLKYAVKDSTDFLETVTNKKSSVYRNVLRFHLFDEQATLQNIKSTFDEIASKLSKEDTVLIYLSGHGVSEDDFYFIPYGVNVDDNFSETALSQSILKDNIAKLSQSNNIFIFLDSCHSGAVDFNADKVVSNFDKVKEQLGENVFILAAAAKDQEALDSFRLENNIEANNGLFAFAVLEGLNGKAGRMRDKIVDNFNLGSYTRDRIKEIVRNQTVKQQARFQNSRSGDLIAFDITQYE